MALSEQNTLEPDLGPEWDTKGVADAGVRQGRSVTSVPVSYQQVSEDTTNQGTPEEPSFQDAVGAAYDLPNVWRRGTGSEHTDRYAGSVLGAVVARDTGADVYDSIEASMDEVSSSVDADATIYSKVNEKTDAALKQSLVSAAGLGPNDSEQLMRVYKELETWNLETLKPWGFESFTQQQLNDVAVLQSAEGSKVLQEDIYQSYALATVANATQDRGLGSKIWDGAKMLLLPGTTMAMGNFVEKFKPSAFGTGVNALGEVFGRIPDMSLTGSGYKAYMATRDKFWKLPVEQRRIAFDGIEKHIRDITLGGTEVSNGNQFIYAGMIMPFVDKSTVQDAKLDYLLDTASFLVGPAMRVGKIGKFLADAAKARKPVQILKDTGNVEAAGHLINKALADRPDRAKKILGMEGIEIAASAQPIKMGSVLPGQIEGVAKAAAMELETEILSKVNMIDQAFAAVVDPSITARRFYFDESAMAARQKEVLGELNDRGTVATIHSTDDTGFVVRLEHHSEDVGKFDEPTLTFANKTYDDAIEDLKDRQFEGDDAAGEWIPQQIDGLKKKIQANNRIIKGLQKDGTTEFSDVRYTFDETGTFSAENLQTGTMPRVASPSQTVDQLMPTQTSSAMLAEFTETQIKGRLDNAVRTVLSGLTPKQFKNLDMILLHGDELKKTFSLGELLHGVDTKWGRAKLTSTKDVAAYHAMRQNFDDIHRVKNYLTRRQLETGGFSELTAKIKTSDGLPIKLYAKKEGGAKTLPDGVLRIYDHKSGEVVDVSSLNNMEQRFEGRDISTGTAAPKKGTIRFYHGGEPYKDGTRWLTEDKAYAEGYASKGSKTSKLQYVDLPEDHPFLKTVNPSYDATGTDHRAPYVHFDAPEDIAKLLQDHVSGGTLTGDWSVVRFRHGYRFGDEVINYGIVQAEKDFKPISGQVLNYSKGYVPRLRPNVMYVVSHKTKRLVDGVSSEARETVHFANLKTDAEDFIARQNASSEYELVPDQRYANSAYTKFDDEYDALNFGGLYNGERTDRTILMGTDGKEAHRMSTYKALSMYQNHVANRYSSNELKMGLIGRFQNTWGKYMSKDSNWEAPLAHQYHNDIPLRRAYETEQRYIKDLIRVPDGFQSAWNGAMRNLGELMEGKPLIGGKARDWVLDWGLRDPTAAIRTATFHLYLGMFNPSQVLVQGFGAITAMAAYPTKAPKIIAQNMALRAAWSMRNSPAAIKSTAEAIGINGDRMVEIVKEIERTGLFDSLKTSADYNASINGISMSGDAARRALDSGLIFMREGEQMARGYGYLLARDSFLSKHPKGKNHKLTDAEVDKVLIDSFRFTMNLNRSNRAGWQKGLLGVPTQFMQVTAKFIEHMVGGSLGYGVRKWTPGEKAKIMLGYLGSFGMAGVPFMDSMLSAATNTYKSVTGDDTAVTTHELNPFNKSALTEGFASDQEFARFIRGGMIQVMMHWITGADPEIASRTSIASGLEDTIDMYANGDRSSVDAILGAFGPGLARTFDALHGIGQIFAYNRTKDLGDEELRQGVMEVAKIFSTTSKASKSLWWYQVGQGVTNKKGQRLFPEMETDEWNSMLIWQTLGFSPAKVGWMYDFQKGTTELKTIVTDRVKVATTILDRYLPAETAALSNARVDNLNYMLSLVNQGLTDAQRDAVTDGIKKHMMVKNPKWIEVLTDGLAAEAQANGKMTAGSLANPLLVPEGTE